jgi:hypothetical protein
MADQNPTGDGDAVALTIPAKHRKFLRRVFEMARDGIYQERDEFPDTLREPVRLDREEAVYDKLLAALDGEQLVIDADVRDVLADLALMIDRENEYRRVITEHEALLGLREQVGRSGSQ